MPRKLSLEVRLKRELEKVGRSALRDPRSREQRGRIVVRFTYPQQPVEDQNKVFFIDAGTEGWVLRHVSEFQNLDAELKLVKNQSFRILDD